MLTLQMNERAWALADRLAAAALEFRVQIHMLPSGARDGDKAPAVSLEVPKLPPHIPGLIPLGSVVGGYIDDLKKQHPGVKVDDPSTNPANGRGRRGRRGAGGETPANGAPANGAPANGAPATPDNGPKAPANGIPRGPEATPPAGPRGSSSP